MSFKKKLHSKFVQSSVHVMDFIADNELSHIYCYT